MNLSHTPSKLLSINNYHYRRGGADAVYLDHVEKFAEMGWDTACFAMSHPDNIASDDSQHFVDEIEFGRNYSLSKKLGMASKIIYSFEAKDKLGLLLKQFRPDIAHVHSVYHHISPSVLHTLKKHGVPVVLTAHDLKLLCPAYKMLRDGQICEKCKTGTTWNVTLNRCIKGSFSLSLLIGIETFVHRLLDIYAKHTDMVVVPSRFFESKFAEWGWSESKIRYIPNYVVMDDYDADFSAGDYFVYCGRISTDKGVPTLVRAAAKAGVRLVVVGDGHERGEVEQLANSLNADVEFAGYKQKTELQQLIRSARAAVLPSEIYENAPMSVLEAFASGKPVIGAKIGGIPELIQHGRTGWLYSSGSVDELTEILSDVDKLDDNTVSTMGRAGRNFVEDNFPVTRYLDSMAELYAELGAGGSS